jgi:ectoine hydroxylase-related dioxygenase (phytanoyl-CoA dioxygenase family)
MSLASQPRPQAADTTQALGLSVSELADFQRQGYLLKRGLYSRQLIDQLRIEVDNLHAREHAQPTPGAWTSWEQNLPEGRAPKIRQLMNSEVVSPIIDAMSRSEEMLSIMRQLIGPDLYLYHSKLMMKAAHDGTFTPWHQDFGYWHFDLSEPTQINCMLAIDPADDGNGAVRMVSGSHLDGLVTHQHFQSDSFSLGLAGDLSAYPSVLIDMEPGDGLFFGPLIIHGSGPNTSDRDRRANTFAFDKSGNRKAGVLDPKQHRSGSL